MICKICKSESKFVFEAKVLRKYNVKYYHCPSCGFLQTEEPYWLSEAYSEAISSLDTGIMQRNLYLSKITAFILLLFFDCRKKFLDYAGGYGVFVRLMRDYGFDFYWYDKYAQNLFARGFEYKEEMRRDIEAITCFEAFEHFVNPMEELENMVSISKNIIFTTELLPKPVPRPQEWWYYVPEEGQHISFYSEETLNYIAKRFDLKYLKINQNLHIFTQNNLNNKLIKLIVKPYMVLQRFSIINLLGLRLKSKVWEDFEHMKNIMWRQK